MEKRQIRNTPREARPKRPRLCRKAGPRRVALHIFDDTSLNREKIFGVLEYARKRSHWEIPIHSRSPFLSLEELKNWEGEGVIGLFSSLADIRALQARGLVVVTNLGTINKKFRVPTVMVDSMKIGRLVAEHLLARKFHRYAFLGFHSPAGNRPAHFLQRGASFMEEVRSAGFECVSHWADCTTGVDDFLRADPWRGIVRGLKLPCAIFACADHAAFGILKACRELGLRVPEDIAVLGVDNDRILCQLATPSLSSIVPRGDLVGYRAAELLDGLLDGRPGLEIHQEIEPGELCLRPSTDIVSTANMEVTAAIRFINAHAREFIDVQDVLRAVTISRRSLERHFRDVTGMGIYEFIRRAHVDVAKSLLKSSGHTIEEVAHLSGLRTAHGLNEAFFTIEGRSALDYRQAARAPHGKRPRGSDTRTARGNGKK